MPLVNQLSDIALSEAATWQGWNWTALMPLILLAACAAMFVVGCGQPKEQSVSKAVVSAQATLKTKSNKKSVASKSSRAVSGSSSLGKPSSIKQIQSGKVRSSRARAKPKMEQVQEKNPDKSQAKSSTTMDSQLKSHKTAGSQVRGHHDSTNSINSYARVEPRKTEKFLEDNLVSVIPAPDEDQ